MYLSNGIQDSKSCFIHDCCDYLASILPGDLLVKRYEKFIVRYNSCGGLHWYYGIAVIWQFLLQFCFLKLSAVATSFLLMNKIFLKQV